MGHDGCPPQHSYGGVAEWFRQGPAKPSTGVRFPSPPRKSRAISSVGERFPDTEEATGSIPVSPTHFLENLSRQGSRTRSQSRTRPGSFRLMQSGEFCRFLTECGCVGTDGDSNRRRIRPDQLPNVLVLAMVIGSPPEALLGTAFPVEGFVALRAKLAWP
jgi:hypothetical protein